jgi:hypothetical protein
MQMRCGLTNAASGEEQVVPCQGNAHGAWEVHGPARYYRPPGLPAGADPAVCSGMGPLVATPCAEDER